VQRRATRASGFTDLEMMFDGKTLAWLGREAGLYAVVSARGSIDALIDTLRESYGRPAARRRPQIAAATH
jgi:hypothetical protein